MDANKFLYALSSLGEMSKGELMDSFYSLCIDSNSEDTDENFNFNYVVLNYLRNMDALGHIEYEGFSNNSTIYPCNPYLVTVTTNPIWTVLCGARSSKMISEIINSAKERKGIEFQLVRQSKESGITNISVLYPDAVYIKGDSYQHIENFAAEFGIKYAEKTKKSTEIAEYSGSLEEYKNNLIKDKYIEEDIDEARYMGFSTENLKFDEKLKNTSNLVEYQFNKWDFQTLFWDNDRGCRVERSWGRFMALNHIGKSVIFYCKSGQWLAVPSSTPLPIILNRALVISSGIVPYKIRSNNLSIFGINSKNLLYDVYFRIPHKLAKILSEKVGQKYIPIYIGDEEETINLI